MADKLTAERRSVNMSKIRSKDMRPELIVRSLTHKMGYRYSLHRKDLPGKPDLVFKFRKKIIFVHGCFWHQHPDPKCLDGRKPKSNKSYWDEKLDKNVKRDKANQEKLKNQGWDILVIWECEIKHRDEVKRKIKRFLK